MNLIAGAGVAAGFLLGILAHEYATHRVADSLGDKSPRLYGRLTLALKPHVDPLGTIILPAIFVLAAIFASPFPVMFGWGKKHQVNPRALRNPSRDPILVALAGPAATLALAILFGVVLRGAQGGAGIVATFAGYAVPVFVLLTIVELLPIPGRDGAVVLQRFLSPSAANKIEELEQYSVLFLLVLFLFLAPILAGMADPVCRAVAGGPCFG